MLTSSYGMGDGNCGNNVNPLTGSTSSSLWTRRPAAFRADPDTTALKDGKHTIAAASAAGTVATRVLITENDRQSPSQVVTDCGRARHARDDQARRDQ
ncbi:hypothetical protein [Microtetraspora glauca]|uniref:Uncharacterized protein n=1 Tax=Microtetraspora glauca TaxID=1996 RepID=A0ABV3GT11_MICGL